MDIQWSMSPRGQILPPPQPSMGYWPPPPWGYPTHPMGPWGRPHGQHNHFHHQRYVPDSCCLLLLFATNWIFFWGLLHYCLYIWRLIKLVVDILASLDIVQHITAWATACWKFQIVNNDWICNLVLWELFWRSFVADLGSFKLRCW
jgi:hypothetical protein